MNNGRFAISVHILTLLTAAENELLSSEYLAGSINVNPVLVRKELSNLRRHGLVESREGKNGGSCLAKPPARIRLSEVYAAVKKDALLGRSKNKPNPDCKIGREIEQHLDDLYDEVEQALMRKLDKTTLADFMKKFE